jgi:hypothetical protein
VVEEPEEGVIAIAIGASSEQPGDKFRFDGFC